MLAISIAIRVPRIGMRIAILLLSQQLLWVPLLKLSVVGFALMRQYDYSFAISISPLWLQPISAITLGATNSLLDICNYLIIFVKVLILSSIIIFSYC